MRQESSKIIEALARFCEAHAEDRNLFPQNKDTVVATNTRGAIISEHKECSSSELGLIRSHKLRLYLEGKQENSINA